MVLARGAEGLGRGACSKGEAVLTPMRSWAWEVGVAAEGQRNLGRWDGGVAGRVPGVRAVGDSGLWYIYRRSTGMGPTRGHNGVSTWAEYGQHVGR